jgi:hypothetical protein
LDQPGARDREEHSEGQEHADCDRDQIETARVMDLYDHGRLAGAEGH